MTSLPKQHNSVNTPSCRYHLAPGVYYVFWFSLVCVSECRCEKKERQELRHWDRSFCVEALVRKAKDNGELMEDTLQDLGMKFLPFTTSRSCFLFHHMLASLAS